MTKSLSTLEHIRPQQALHLALVYFCGSGVLSLMTVDVQVFTDLSRVFTTLQLIQYRLKWFGFVISELNESAKCGVFFAIIFLFIYRDIYAILKKNCSVRTIGFKNHKKVYFEFVT